MIPVLLKLKNFLSYIDEEVDFSKINCAAVCGENGAGKSSLVTDAFTFALFGQGSKGGVKELDNYVSRGTTDCVVEFIFLLNDLYHKVVRGRNLKKNKTTLEFLASPDMVEWTPITGGGVNDVQKTIEETVRMNYKLFTSSSLILQGKSDSFTSDMTDTERKKALADILGLDIWDKIQEYCKGELSQLKQDIWGFEKDKQQHDEVIATEPTCLMEQAAYESSKDSSEKEISEKEALILELQQKIANKAVISSQVNDARKKIASLSAMVKDVERDSSSAMAKISAIDKNIISLNAMLARESEINAAVVREEVLTKAILEMDVLLEEYNTVYRKMNEVEKNFMSWNSSHELRKTKLSASLPSYEKQASLLSGVPCGEKDKSSCPLLAMAREGQNKVIEIKNELVTISKEVNPYTSQKETLASELAVVLDKYNQKNHQMAKIELMNVRKISSALSDLKVAFSRIETLKTSKQEQEALLVSLAEKKAGFEAEIYKEEEAIVEKMEELDTMEETESVLEKTKAELPSLKTKLNFVVSSLGQIALKLENIAVSKKEATKLAKKIEKAKTRQQIFMLLESACSKKAGVPALIVENAVPEIEHLTNSILSKMASGRLSVRMDTQSATKSTGTMQETLRIVILDSGIEGPYQTYSGAERFMTDLAIRVALSKFLANRAGAQIGLFVLDEGIACADSNNRQAILNAIASVSSEFKKMFIVTHLDELKDAFPQRLEVNKTTDGSKVSMIA